MARPQKPQDAYVTNGWYLTIPVPGLGSNARFETLEGLSRQSGSVQTVDAGTNKVYKFANQITEFGDMTLTRTYDGSAADRAMETLCKTMIANGTKLPVVAVKMHNGNEVFSVAFEGFRIVSEAHPSWDVAGTDKYVVSYSATCDDWDIIPVGV
jgi:T4-like virus tail tube protein gp19|nr:MAG TPA: Pvc1, Pvc9, Pvc11, Pvc12, Pvc4, Photorhabdus asymbiotica, PVC, contractile.5A [Caudoviricetes sp.]